MHSLTRAIALLLATASAAAQADSFTYRGQLNEDGVAANGRYDLQPQFAKGLAPEDFEAAITPRARVSIGSP